MREGHDGKRVVRVPAVPDRPRCRRPVDEGVQELVCLGRGGSEIGREEVRGWVEWVKG